MLLNGAGMYEATTDMIIALVAARGGHGGIRSWFGVIGDLRSDDRPEFAIAKHLGLAPGSQQFGADSLTIMGLQAAKEGLADVAVNSMVHWSGSKPSAALSKAVDDGFAPLGSEAHCFSNGYLTSNGGAWMPMTTATFDTGVICHNGTVGFAVWFDEED